MYVKSYTLVLFCIESTIVILQFQAEYFRNINEICCFYYNYNILLDLFKEFALKYHLTNNF